MKALFTPTLVRRIVAALLLAFALAWCAVATYTYLDFRANVRTHSGLQQAGRGLLDALAGIARDELAINAVQVTAQQFNAVRRQDSQLPGDLLFQLRSTDGQELFASPAIAGTTLQGAPGQVVDTRLNGQAYWLFTGQSGRWQLLMAEPQVSTQWVLQWIFDSLALPFLVAFPFVLLPVWIAATRGLKPLRMLGQTIEQRAAGDLSPLGVLPRYAELTPLVTALEDMLLQLRGKVARERSFVHDAAHELRTPLAVISAQAHVLSRTTDLRERAEASQHLQQAVARGSHLVQQLLELATMDAATHAPAQSVDVADLTRQHLAQATPHAASLGVELILDAPDSLPLALPVALYESVLRNLLDNAVKYAGGAGEVTLTLAWRDGALQLAVADSGPGIPAHEHALVFERFYRGTGASALASVSGTGLGLAIVRQACVRMGGDIALHGRSGGGCVFVATMPVAATAGG